MTHFYGIYHLTILFLLLGMVILFLFFPSLCLDFPLHVLGLGKLFLAVNCDNYKVPPLLFFTYF